MACISRCIIALVAFVWHFSTVCFQMSPQMSHMWGCKLALVAFVYHDVSESAQPSEPHKLQYTTRNSIIYLNLYWLFFVTFLEAPKLALFSASSTKCSMFFLSVIWSEWEGKTVSTRQWPSYFQCRMGLLWWQIPIFSLIEKVKV